MQLPKCNCAYKLQCAQLQYVKCVALQPAEIIVQAQNATIRSAGCETCNTHSKQSKTRNTISPNSPCKCLNATAHTNFNVHNYNMQCVFTTCVNNSASAKYHDAVSWLQNLQHLFKTVKHAKIITQTPPFKCPNVLMAKHSLVNLHCAKMHSKSLYQAKQMRKNFAYINN